MDNTNIPITDELNRFNAYTSETRNRIETLIKQILVISGGILTITISAFLTNSAPQISKETMPLLELAWLELSSSIILCLFFMLIQILGLAHVGIQKKNKLEKEASNIEIMNTWLPLRILSVATGLLAFSLCVHGVYTISQAAVSLINA
jgi:hypothetical protein